MANLCELAKQANDLVKEIYVIGIERTQNYRTQQVVIEYKNQTCYIPCKSKLLQRPRQALVYLIAQFAQFKQDIDKISSSHDS